MPAIVWIHRGPFVLATPIPGFRLTFASALAVGRGQGVGVQLSPAQCV
jgi:hypothetical protein